MAEEKVGSGKPELDRVEGLRDNYGVEKASERAMTATEVRMTAQELEHGFITRHFCRAYYDLAKVVHEDNVVKGFWEPPGRNVGEMLMLAVTELSEGMEAWRHDAVDQHLPQYQGLTVEIADCIIRLMDMGQGLGLPIADALIDKLAYNRTRPYKHGKKC